MGNYYFGLKKRPFIAEPVPEAYCAFGDMESARIQISRCIERQEGVALVSGLSGMGKTLLCRTLQKQFQERMETVLLNGKNLTDPRVFFETLLSRFRAPFDGRNLTSMREALISLLGTSRQFRRGLLLLIDDAQAAALGVFEEIRQLLDLTGSPELGVRVVLFGDPSLEEKLTFSQLESFSQRITLRCFLESLNRDETTAFLREELAQAGDVKGLFSRDVCREIFRFTDGQPRLTNQLADHVLVMAAESRGTREGAENAELPEENGIFSSVDSDSVLETGKFDDWESDPFTESSSSLKLLKDPELSSEEDLVSVLDGSVDLAAESDAESDAETKTETAANEVETSAVGVDYSQPVEPEWITPELVQRAWRSLQQFGGNDDLECGPAVVTECAWGENDAVLNGSVSSNAIEFGSLDDELDLGASIELGGDISLDDSTRIWSYDEAQEVRDAIEEANALPYDWEVSAQENAIRSDREEALCKSGEEERTDCVDPVTVSNSSNQAGASPETSVCVSSPSAKADLQGVRLVNEPARESVGESKTDGRDDDWWDILKESSSFNFPSHGDPVVSSPSYSSRDPGAEPRGNVRVSQYGAPSGKHEAYPKCTFQEEMPRHEASASAPYLGMDVGSAFRSSPVFSEHGGRNASSASAPSGAWLSSYSDEPVRSERRHTSVDQLILEALMEDTVHSMGLLQKILLAVREENLQNTGLSQISDYWLELQELVKGAIRRIAQERSFAAQTHREPLFSSFSGRPQRNSVSEDRGIFRADVYGTRTAEESRGNADLRVAGSKSVSVNPFHEVLHTRQNGVWDAVDPAASAPADFSGSASSHVSRRAGYETGAGPYSDRGSDVVKNSASPKGSSELDAFLTQAVLKALAAGRLSDPSADPFREVRADAGSVPAGSVPAGSVSAADHTVSFGRKRSDVRIEPEFGSGDSRRSVPPADFYQPETLIENGILQRNSVSAGDLPMNSFTSEGAGVSGERFGTESLGRAPVRVEADRPELLRDEIPLEERRYSSADGLGELSGTLENTEEGDGQELSLLRSILQKCRTADALDMETQERLFQIISQLQTLNLNS